MGNKFESLPIFTVAHTLALSVYKLTLDFPTEEKYGLTSQLRRSASSIVANIIEGNAREHKKEFLEFLYISRGSLEETKYHLLLARDLGYIKNDSYHAVQIQCDEVGKQLTGLIRYYKNK